ncbi:hypothetical protein RhiJN_21670 [Ceratobasidium sp. AG-Ba]|nr:hypothetical protein RhiJN_21670 [Ceratobasidium sp. AG-Ba]
MSSSTSPKDQAEHYAYLEKYSRTSKTWTPRISPRTVAHAQRALDAIRKGQETSLEMMECVISLPAYPYDLHILNDPGLVRACITRLSQLQQKDSLQPFGYEQGYLLFRIIIVCIAVLLLYRDPNYYEWVIEQMLMNRGSTDPYILLMEHSRAAIGIVAAGCSQGHRSIESFLGWSSDSLLQPLIPQSAGLALLDVLWKDRKGFLRAWAETYSPELYSIIAILWRCVESAGTFARRVALMDIIGRYSLVMEADSYYLRGLKDKIIHGPYESAMPMAGCHRVDLEDSRMALRIYISRFGLDSASDKTPTLAHACYLLRYLFPFPDKITKGTEDLFAPVLRVTCEYFWLVAARKAPQNDVGLEPEDSSSIVLTIW